MFMNLTQHKHNFVLHVCFDLFFPFRRLDWPEAENVLSVTFRKSLFFWKLFTLTKNTEKHP